MHFLERVADAYSMSEAPKRFFYWAAAAAIAATVRKNVWLDRAGVFKQWPNIYVFIIGRSGLKKSIPIDAGKKLVEKAGNTRVIVGRNSFQKIIEVLGQQITLENGNILRDAQTLIVSGELSSLLLKDPDALNVMTDLYDTHSYEEEWINSLKNGVSKLKHPCVNILAATNEELFPETVQSKDFKGGFIARTFIIYSNDSAGINALVRKNGPPPDIDSLAGHLKAIKDVNGEFKWSDDAADIYELWYNDLMSRLQRRLIQDPTGLYGRLGDQVLKLAMIISLAYGDSLVLEKIHIEEAISECEVCCIGTKTVTLGRGKSLEGSAMRTIIRTLIDHPDHKMTREQILNRFWGEISVFDMDRIAETLQAAGAIVIKMQGKNYTYELRPNALDLYVNFKKSIF